MRGTLFAIVLCGTIVFCARSAFGDGNVSTEMNIKANHDFGNYKMGEYNKRLVLGCAVDNYHAFKHTWKWYHNDQEIKMDYVTPHPFIVSNNLLIISYLNDSTVGKYSCKLFYSNTDVKHIGSQEINVIMKPTLSVNRVQIFNLGEPISLKCLVQGVPTPTITWEFENTTIKPSENVSISTDVDGNSILHINATTNEHTGQYFCVGRYATILPPVVSEPCFVLNEDNLEMFVNMTNTLESEWDEALETVAKIDVELHVAKARFFNTMLWMKVTGRWIKIDDRWIEPFQQNLLESDLAVIEAKTATLVSSARALEARDRNIDLNGHDFSMLDEMEKLVIARQAALKLVTVLSEELADVNWLMEATDIRTSNRKMTYVIITRSDNKSKFNIMATISK